MREKRAEKIGNKRKKIVSIILIVLILVAGALAYLKFIGWNKEGLQTASLNENLNGVKEEEIIKEPKTFEGKERPIAVMIDNHIGAVPQAGLKEADLVYEIIVEGGETRLMLVFKDKDIDKIGPIRSSRHYFLDYALENDAIYVHYGWSPQAESDIDTLGVNNINGIFESSSAFWRVSDKYAPHNVVTTTEKILEIAERKGYRTTTNEDPILNYVAEEVNLEGGKKATDITIPYSSYNSVEYKYNKKSKQYTRYTRGEKQVDWTTGDTITTKNIIIEFAENYTLDDGSGKGRQTLNNVKTLKGYYITNGKAIPITCTKKSRAGKTVYKDSDGKEINVNDGKTFIQICPINADVTFVDEENE